MTTIAVDILNIQQTARYIPQQFVGRQDELALVNAEINNLRTESFRSRPILNFWAVQGSGKSWLLHHIAKKHTQIPTNQPDKKATLPLLYEFSATPAPNRSLIQHVTKQLAQTAQNQLPPNNIPADLTMAAQTGNSVFLANALIKLTKTFILILLLDGAEKVPVDKWQEIERHILEPVLVTGKALLIVSGRRQMPPWRNFELRRRVMDTDRTYLLPFGDAEVEQQIEKLKQKLPFKVSEIRPYTANSPLLVRALVQTFQQQHEQPDTWLRPFRDQAIEQLLHKLDDEAIEILKAVSTLRFYRLDSVHHMLSQQKNITNPDTYYFRLLQSLEPDTDLAWWDGKHRAYVTSEIIRNLFNEQQKEDNLADFLAEHKQALQMYTKFAEAYPAGSEEHLIERLYHLGCIYQVDKNIESATNGAREVLAFAQKHLTLSAQLNLSNQIENDSEVAHMLPEKVWLAFKQALSDTLAEKQQT